MGDKKCFLSLRLTALLSAEGKNLLRTVKQKLSCVAVTDSRPLALNLTFEKDAIAFTFYVFDFVATGL
jgi:hypothetical protein